jgi:putative membrane protein
VTVSADRPYRRLSPLTPLVRSGILVVGVLASTWDDVLRRDLGPVAWVLLAVLVGGAAYGAASWLRTKYWIEADELRVDTGVLSRQSRRIRVDRLQGIDISQPFVARLLGLAELKMDVAGGGAREGSLAFLRLQDAHELRAVLLARRDAVVAERAGARPGGAGPDVPGPPGAGPAVTIPADTSPAVTGPLGPAPVVPERVLARLDLGTLLLSLLLSPETVLFTLAAVALGAVFAVVGEVGGAAGVVPVIGGFALTQFRKLSGYYRFTVTESPVGLQVRRGLFELDAQTVSLARVQGVVVTEPFLWRHLGWARLDVAVAGTAGSAGDGKPAASTVMPVAPREEVLRLARRLLSAAGAPDPDAVVLRPPPLRARWAVPVWHRALLAGVGDQLVVSREGRLTRRTHVVPHARVQSLQLRQGPWQRRLGLADVVVDSPPGPVKVRARHRDVAEARRLLDLENDAARRARLTARLEV